MFARGVSPAIGTLVLLAIVAILAAVLGMFALGFTISWSSRPRR